METTIRTSSIYQRLDILCHSLTSVLPDVTSPVASCYMLKAILAEISYIYNEACTLKEKWRELLPFEEDDTPEVQWKRWSDNLQPRIIERSIKKNKTYVFDYVDMNDDDGAIVGKKAQMYENLYSSLEKLSLVLRQIHYIVRGTLPESIIKLYDSLKLRCEKEYTNWQNDLSSMTVHLLEEHKNYFYNLVLENFIKLDSENPDSTDYLKTPQQKWNEMVDKDGIPIPIIVGRYIYENRFYLNTIELNFYYEYVRILEFSRNSSGKKEKSRKKKTNETTHFSLKEKKDTPLSVVGIFDENIDIKLIKEIIQDEFIPLMKPKNRWTCVWRILKDKNFFTKKSTIDQFCELMSSWFPNDFKKDDIHVYRYTHLATKNRKRWSQKKYNDDIKTHKKASPKTYQNFVILYNELDEILTERYFGKKQ